MAEKTQTAEVKVAGPEGAVTPPPPRRGPGHRGADVRDTVAEMAAKAHEISLEAGSKMAAAMKEVINAAAGITAFAIESARDLVQYMVRRGQMTQEEADKLIREAEAAHGKRPKSAAKPTAKPHAAKASAKKPAPKKAHKPAHAKAKPAHKPAAKKKKK
jgi:Putative porin